MKSIRQSTFCLVVFVTLSGCVVHPPARPDDPYYAPVMQPSSAAPVASNGSLYTPGQAVALFGDRKALRVGDIITVVLQERTTSQKTSNIEMSKESDVNLGSGAQVFGATPSLGGLSLDTSISGSREFSGEARTDQRNQLSGNITVTVVDVFPNGTLVVRGEKWITLNRGDEYIRISGLVRPDDVTRDNMVSSTKVANARITYSGTGEFANSNHMGWLGKFFNSPLWPF